MYKILVAVDGSEHSLKTIEETIKRAGPVQAEVTVLFVSENLSISELFDLGQSIRKIEPLDGDSLREHIDLIKENRDKIALNIFEKTAEVLRENNIKVKTLWKKGRPADVIFIESEQGRYDLLIIGNKGLGAFGGLLLGSVTNELIHRVNEDILIVK